MLREVSANLADWRLGGKVGASGKLGSDSCYSRSDTSTDSEPGRVGRAGPPQRGDTAATARLERLCPRVRPLPARPARPQPRPLNITDCSASLSSVDTSSSSSDLWNVRAMPDVPVARLNKPPSLRANPGMRQRPNQVGEITIMTQLKLEYNLMTTNNKLC